MIKKILSSKPHNSHYLNKYIKFIENCKTKNSNIILEYSENHHICPKAKDLFPEYKDLKIYKWNSISLTFRQHVIAHLLLNKTFNTISTMNAVIFTTGNGKYLNSKAIELVKTKLSNSMRGIFTRGYNSDGTPNVSKETKLKLSKNKTDFYSIQSNRDKVSKNWNSYPTYINRKKSQKEEFISLNKSRIGKHLTPSHKESLSISCKNFWASEDGKKLRLKFSNERKYKSRAITENHRNNIISANQSRKNKPRLYDTLEWREKQSIIRKNSKNIKRGIHNPFFIGLFQTPIGIFTTKSKISTLVKYCINDIVLSNAMCGVSPILNRSVSGLTTYSLGFKFIPKDSALIEQYYDVLDLAHQCEPTHPLSLELNDYLLKQNLLH